LIYFVHDSANPNPFMKPEETIDFHIRWAWSKISKAYNNEAAKNGGTMAIGYVLLNIDKDGTPSTKLGPRMGMEPTSLSRILKSMEDLKLIKRIPDKNDKRIVKVTLTSKGIEMREVSKNVVIRFNTLVSENIEQKKLETCFEVLQQINMLLETNIFEDQTIRVN
jgi:DNA-binding MarR family transcriptional regulator